MPPLSNRYSYSQPDVGIFAGGGAAMPMDRRLVRTPGSLPSGERVSLPYFGKSMVVERRRSSSRNRSGGSSSSAARASGPSYPSARSRTEREEARTARSSQHSGRRSSRSGGAQRSYGSGTLHGRRSSTWNQREGFVPNPRFQTRSQLLDYRHAGMLPHHTFDVDGDGVVSSEDFALAQAFDVNKDGVLQDDEKHELRKEMVQRLITKYRRLPHAESQEAENLIRRFTKDLDNTVEASDFIHNYNKLLGKTAVINTHDSTNMHECTQPIVVQERAQIAEAFKGFDVNGDGVISHDEFRTGVKALVRNMTDGTVDELLTIVDKDGDGEIDYLEFAKQCTDPGQGRARQVLDQVTKGLTSARGAGQREFEKVDTYREGRTALYEPKKYTGVRTRQALLKQRKSVYRDFAATQLNEKLQPILSLH